MNDDELSKALREAARETDPAADGRWEALAHGKLGDAERATLHAEAEGSPSGRLASEAFAPLGAAARERLAETLLAELTRARRAPLPEAAEAPAPGPRLPPPRSRARRRTRFYFAAASVLVAAAALAVGFFPRSLPLLPAYQLHLEAGLTTLRSPGHDLDRDTARAEPGSRVEIVLTPRIDVSHEVTVRSFLFHDRRLEPWSPALERSETGAFRIAGRREELFGATRQGTLDLFFFVGRPGDLPVESEALTYALAPPARAVSSRWQLLRARIDLSPGGTGLAP